MRLEGRLEDVQRFPVGPVTMAWTQSWKSFSMRALRFRRSPPPVWCSARWCCLVGVRFEEPGAAGAQGAVDEAFDGANGQRLLR